MRAEADREDVNNQKFKILTEILIDEVEEKYALLKWTCFLETCIKFN